MAENHDFIRIVSQLLANTILDYIYCSMNRKSFIKYILLLPMIIPPAAAMNIKKMDENDCVELIKKNITIKIISIFDAAKKEKSPSHLDEISKDFIDELRVRIEKYLDEELKLETYALNVTASGNIINVTLFIKDMNKVFTFPVYVSLIYKDVSIKEI